MPHSRVVFKVTRARCREPARPELVEGGERFRRAGIRFLTALAFLLAWPHAARAFNDVPYLANLADLDAFVADKFSSLTNEAATCPIGPFNFGLNGGMFTFAPDSDLAALTNSLVPLNVCGVPAYHLAVIEKTQDTSRVWFFEGTNGIVFHTNAVPAFDSEAWVRLAYRHDPPVWLTGTNLARWYADRDRCRLFLTMTLVNSNDWPTLQATLRAAATNTPPPETFSPALPADTNSLSFIGVRPSSAGALDLWLYTPAARPVAVVASTNLTEKRWALLGTFGAVPAFNLWHAAGNGSNAAYNAGFVDVDTDGDGLPNFLEAFVLGSDSNYFDTVGSSLGDYYRLLVFGLDPLSLDSNADGIPDEWAIANGFNPFDSSIGDLDPDGDGLCNRVEYLLGTNPRKPSDLDAANAATLRIATPMLR
jgi:hypothetical protein